MGDGRKREGRVGIRKKMYRLIKTVKKRKEYSFLFKESLSASYSWF